MKLNAWKLARAWNSVALAHSDDRGRPALFRTTLIELFSDGIRLVSTDSFVLLKAWVPGEDWDVKEPGADVLPEEVAICRDVDHRVVALMKYAQSITKQDGADTPIRIEIGFGQLAADQAQLSGMVEETVWFRLDHERYDERIEAPQFEGAFPEWRPLWFGHKWQQTGVVQFGADGILRLGKLSALWDKAGLEFHLGGASGVAKVVIKAPDVSVTGLAMPDRSDVDDLAEKPDTVVPPSEEGLDVEYGEALDDFLAQVLAGEAPPDHDDALDEATRAQMKRALTAATEAGVATVQIIVDALDVSHERASQLITLMTDEGWVIADDEDADKFVVIADPAGIDPEPDDDTGDEEPL